MCFPIARMLRLVGVSLGQGTTLDQRVEAEPAILLGKVDVIFASLPACEDLVVDFLKSATHRVHPVFGCQPSPPRWRPSPARAGRAGCSSADCVCLARPNR